MPDILPADIPTMRRIEEAAHRVFHLYGYEEIRTPIFEETRLFVRGIGESSDIVEKEMYTFAGGDDSITLRPEATAPVVRAVVEHNLLKNRGFWKLYYIGHMFRKERPQAGRQRQFGQIGCEAVGSLEPDVDAESICLAVAFFKEVGLHGIKIKLNSMGCPSCRAAYREALKASLADKRPHLCDDCRARFERNVFRILDCKKETCKAIARETPPMREYLDEACRKHFESVTAMLRESGLAFEQDDHLVRGFDYYTRTVFELAHESLGARDAVCGGGRYDNLVEELGGPSAGCVGFAVGVVPTLLALERTATAEASQAPTLTAYVIAVSDAVRGRCFALTETLRAAGVSTDLDHERRSLKAQMRSANRLGAEYAIVLGPDELAEGCVKLKAMSNGTEEKLATNAAIARLSLLARE